jgi:hypothetical protein
LTIDTFDLEQHPKIGLVNVVTGKVVYPKAFDIGKQQMNSFEAGWPESFHEPI